jgi:hypothetical protein
MNGNSSFRKIVSQFRNRFAVPQNRFAKDGFLRLKLFCVIAEISSEQHFCNFVFQIGESGAS